MSDSFKNRNMPAAWRRNLKDQEFTEFKQRQLEFEQKLGDMFGCAVVELRADEEGLDEFSNVRNIYDKLQ